MTERGMGQIVTFYSYKGGTGRTMALSNVAWILAASGKRVLVADWDLESPGLHRFFKPFLNADSIRGTTGVIDLIRSYEDETMQERDRPERWYEEYARVQHYAFAINWRFPDLGRLDFLSAGLQNNDYAGTVGALNWDNFWDRLSGGQFFDALRADMKRNYDYTLIDSRTGLSDVADICTIHLPDTLVDCFTLSDQGIEGAADVARSVQKGYSGQNSRQRLIRILPVSMRVDQAEKEKADAGRAVAMRRFADLPTGMTDNERHRYWAEVEVPYRPFYAYEETLAVFGDRPGSRTSLLSAYETLTSYVTDGSVTALVPMEESVRLREKARFERRPPELVDDEIVLRYAPEDLVWAEWIDHLLTSAGVRVTDPAIAGQPAEEISSLIRALTIVSPAYIAAGGRLPQANRPDARPPIAVYVADMRQLPEFPPDASINLVGLSATSAADRLLRQLGRPGPARDDDPLAGGARFPGVEPDVFSAPARNARFTGREEEIRQLRAQLRTRGTAVVLQPFQLRSASATLPVALHGMGGVGKTQVALEYVHRFRSAYDIVWWVQADPPQFIDVTLVDLAGHLGVTSEPTAVATARSVLQALRRGQPSDRWLVVFDNAEDLEGVGRFLPEGHGHVIVTSRNSGWGEHARPIQVDVFRRQESVAHLRQRVPTITDEEANEIADALGDLPIAVAAAGALLADTLTPVPEYLRQIEQHGPRTVEATLGLSLDRLRSQSPAAYRLLQLCSVLAPEIAQDLLTSDQMAVALSPVNPAVSERLTRSALIQDMNRLSLIKLDLQLRRLHVHRLLQAVVRERMSNEEVASAQHQVHLVLARSRPRGEVDDPAHWPQFRELWPHLVTSDAVSCTDEAVRQLLIDRVRYLWLRGDLDQGEQLGGQIAAAWASELARLEAADVDVTSRDSLRRQLLHLRFNLANVIRSQGRFDEARKIDEEVLAEQTALLGPRHPHTLMTAGSLAGDLRGLGRYAEALPRDESTYRTWAEVFGEDQPRTLAAANNLAVSYRALGDFQAARLRDEDAFQRRRAVLGRTHPNTLHSQSHLGRDLREAGDYEKSVILLRSVYEIFSQEQGEDAVVTLNAQANLAVSLRSAGRADEAAPLLDDAYQKLRNRLGEANPDTLACRLSRSANLLATGAAAQAVSEMEAVTKLYEKGLHASHPHTLVCVSNLSAASRAMNDTVRARELAVRATEGFDRALGENHPYTLAASMNLASAMVETEDLESAREHMRQVFARMAAVLGEAHPDTLTCESHVAIVTRRLDESVSAGDVTGVIQRLADTIGASHPIVLALQEGQLVHRILDPHPF
jgi:CO dehydrogenase nickel-insertion accessory protein CooC1